MVYDLIIIGAGPAGITAAVYAYRSGLDFIVISQDIGGQTSWSSDIENYTGYQFITGPELTDKFKEHISSYNIKVQQPEKVMLFKKEGELILIETDKGSYKSKALIIASGKVSKKLNALGEDEFKNKGVTYCAICDGPIFKGKDVAVIGGGNSALDAAIQLDKIASKIYIINAAKDLTASSIMQDKIKNNSKIAVYNNAKVKAIKGSKFVESIEIQIDDKQEDISVKGVFVEIGLIPNSDFAQGIDKNDISEIKVNCKNETNIKGVFAAGDVTDVPEKQIIIAAGEGAKAALSAFKYISTFK